MRKNGYQSAQDSMIRTFQDNAAEIDRNEKLGSKLTWPLLSDKNAGSLKRKMTEISEDTEPSLHCNIKVQKLSSENVDKQDVGKRDSSSDLKDVNIADSADVTDDLLHYDNGPVGDASDEDRVYTENSEMNSFLPVAEELKKQKDLISEELLSDEKCEFEYPLTIESTDVFITCWTNFLQSSDISNYFPECNDELEQISAYHQQNTTAPTNDTEEDQPMNQEEWTLRADLYNSTTALNENESDVLNEYWQEDRYFYTVEQIGNMASWTEDQKASTKVVVPEPSNIDVSTLNKEQKKSPATPPSPLRQSANVADYSGYVTMVSDITKSKNGNPYYDIRLKISPEKHVLIRVMTLWNKTIKRQMFIQKRLSAEPVTLKNLMVGKDGTCFFNCYRGSQMTHCSDFINLKFNESAVLSVEET
eukprot:gene2576-2975_t